MHQGRLTISVTGRVCPLVFDCTPVDMDSLTQFAASLYETILVDEIVWCEIDKPLMLFVYDENGHAWQIIPDRP